MCYRVLITFVALTRLGRMVHAGLVGKWHLDEVTKMKQSASQKKGTVVGQGRVEVRPLALDHLQVQYLSQFKNIHYYSCHTTSVTLHYLLLQDNVYCRFL